MAGIVNCQQTLNVTAQPHPLRDKGKDRGISVAEMILHECA